MANRNVARAVRLALIAAGTASAGVYAPGVVAQDVELEQIVVTGSRIARPDYESSSPIVSVSEALFQQSGTQTVDTVINSLPQFVPAITSTSNNPSNGGQSNIDLRGLGSNRVLVLMDGVRVVPANGSGTVDVNLIPAALIKNVEIISGGASAVYGSDAISGVVNFKMIDDFEGVELDAGYGITDRSDGDEYHGTITAGMNFAEDRGNIVASVGYTERKEVLAGARDFSDVALGWFDNLQEFRPLGSPTFEEGRVGVAASQGAIDQVFAQYGFAPGTVKQTTFGFNRDGTLFTVGDNTPGSVLNFRDAKDASFNDASYTYNFAPVNYLQLPLERTNVFLNGKFEFSENAELYARGIWANYTADTQLAPTPLSQVFTPVTNPFIPADLATLLASRSTPTSRFGLTRRMTEIGPRIESNEFDVYQAIVGLRGKLFSTGWTYDVYGSTGKVEIDSQQQGNVSREKWEDLTYAADGGVALCGGFNPFGKGAITPECAAYMTVATNPQEEVKQTIFEGVLSGPVFDLPAGSIQAALGAMYKDDSYDFIPDDALARQIPQDRTNPNSPVTRFDIAGFNAALPISGDVDSTEFFAELLVPILKDLPGAKRLDATLGYRWADYSSIDDPVDSWKAELLWQPVEMASLRGSYQKAVRAPSVTELFSPQVPNFPPLAPSPNNDPCNTGSAARTGATAAQVRQLCIDTGVPAAIIDRYTFSGSQAEGLAGGNPDLFEETANTYTAGIVLRSPWANDLVSGLQLSVDYYNIEIEDAVSAIPASTFIGRCYDVAYNPTFAANNVFCNFFDRKPDDGTITNALEVNANVGGYQTDGIDVQIDWAADIGPGRASLNWIMTFVMSWEVQEIPGDPFEALEGTSGKYSSGSSFPEEKSTMNVRYDIGGWDLTAQWRYVGEMTDYDIPDFKLDAKNYFDLTAEYHFGENDGVLDGLSIRGGVINVANTDPMIYPAYQQSNTDPTVYDVLGRRYFVNLNYKF